MATTMTKREALNIALTCVEQANLTNGTDVLAVLSKMVSDMDAKNEKSKQKRATASADHTAQAMEILTLMQADKAAKTCADWWTTEGVAGVVDTKGKLTARLGLLEDMGLIEVTHPKKSGPKWYKAK